MSARHKQPRLRCRVDEDAGFSIVEAIVAVVILGVAAAITAGLVTNVLAITADALKRSTASSLAASKMERVRQLAATRIADGRSSETMTVGGTTYTVVQDATYLTRGGASSACQGSGTLAYKRVTVEVTWPNMGTTAPVTSETLRALGFDDSSGGLNRDLGALGVLVTDEAGDPVAGARVVVRVGSATGAAQPIQITGRDGCAVFTGLTAGQNYYSSATRTGFVNQRGGVMASDSGAGITANQLTKTGLSLAEAGRLTMNIDAPSGATVPTTAFPVDVTTSVWTPTTPTLSPGTAPLESNGRVLSAIYPSIYTTAVCKGASNATTQVRAGRSESSTIEFGAVEVRTALGFTNVTATNANCGSVSVPVGWVNSGSGSRVALPAGTWTLRSLSGATSSVTVTPGDTVTAVVLL